MKATSIMLLALGFFLFSGCTKDVVFPAQPELVGDIITDEGLVFHSTPSDTTIQLQVDSSAIAVAEGIITVHLSGSNGYDIVELAPQQTIKFINVHGQASEIEFDITGFSERSGNVSIDFELDGQQLAGLQLSSLQSIIVEEIIMN